MAVMMETTPWRLPALVFPQVDIRRNYWGGQHAVYDYESDQGIVVIDYLDESKIETIKLGDGSYTYTTK